MRVGFEGAEQGFRGRGLGEGFVIEGAGVRGRVAGAQGKGRE